MVPIRREPCAVAIPASVTRDVMERPKEHSYCSLSRQSPKREAPKRILFVYEIKHGAALRILIRTCVIRSDCRTTYYQHSLYIPSHSRKYCDALVSYLGRGIAFYLQNINMKCSMAGFSRPRTVTVRLTSCTYLYLCFCCRGSGDGERKTHQS